LDQVGSRTTLSKVNLVIGFSLLAFGAIAVSLHASQLARMLGEPWQTGDWLINYGGGLVRRGLIGHLLTVVAVDGWQLLWFVALTQILLLVTLFGCSAALFWRTSASPAWLMLLLSPAFLMFPVLYPFGGLRKELFILAAAAWLGVVIRYRLAAPWALLSYVAFAVGAFSHEVVALTVPVLVYLLVAGSRAGVLSARHAKAASAGLVLVAAMALGLSLAAVGTAEQAAKICEWVAAKGLSTDVCAGSIHYFQTPIGEAIAQVRQVLPGYWAYAGYAVLALVPIYLVGARRRQWLLVGVLYLCLVPVFLTGMDYGRWIYLATALASIAMLATWESDGLVEHSTPEAFALAFILLWSMDYTSAPVQPPMIMRVLVKDYVREVGEVKGTIEDMPWCKHGADIPSVCSLGPKIREQAP
jgi:hypothetical protein